MPTAPAPSRAHAVLFAATLLAGLVAGCGPHSIVDRRWPDAYWRDGSYVLIAADTETQMDLCFEMSDQTFSLIGPTVYAVGADARYVVAKQHPTTDGRHFDPAVTNYYVIERPAAPAHRRDLHVIGPLSNAEFAEFDRAHDLPDFSTRFTSLEWQSTGE